MSVYREYFLSYHETEIRFKTVGLTSKPWDLAGMNLYFFKNDIQQPK